MNKERTFVGFGFGAIQAGLFLYEAWRGGRFGRLVVAEVVAETVEAIRANGGYFGLNVATPSGIERHRIGPVEVFNPVHAAEREQLVDAIGRACEIATALPSVRFYETGDSANVAGILADGLRMKTTRAELPAAVIYTAENHNHAAEILTPALERRLKTDMATARTQALNTVIGKMSGVVTDSRQIAEQELWPMVPGGSRAFLVEAFNRILITQIALPAFRRGLEAFEEKPDLLPFEEAKLYGHNATHALIGYLLHAGGATFMSEAVRDPKVLDLARDAFVRESGEALCRRHAGVDPLFTAGGYRAYAEDLLERMMNPHLRDTVERVTRDPRRKLEWNDRLIGTMRLALGQGIAPKRYARGAAAALALLARDEDKPVGTLMKDLWGADGTEAERRQIEALVEAAR